MERDITLAEKQEEALTLLDAFSQFTSYKYGFGNPYIQWLNSLDRLDPAAVRCFLCAWYPGVGIGPRSCTCLAAYPDSADRKGLWEDVGEEDGLMPPGDDPHYDFLEQLINKLGGPLVPDEEAEAVIAKFHNTLGLMTPAESSGVLAGVEHPALTISDTCTGPGRRLRRRAGGAGRPTWR